MPKCGGDVSFHKEMTVPGEAITKQGHEEHTPPIEEDRVKQEEDASKCAHEMPTPCGWFWVLIDIERPELFHASEIHIHKPESENSLSDAP